MPNGTPKPNPYRPPAPPSPEEKMLTIRDGAQDLPATPSSLPPLKPPRPALSMGKQPIAERYGVGYVRVSTAEQAKEGNSLDAQRGRIAAYFAARGITNYKILGDEGASGAQREREGLRQAIDICKANSGVLVVYSLSRLSRSLPHILELSTDLNAHNCDFISLSESFDTTSAAGKLLFHIMAAIAEFEREVISERIMDALDYLRKTDRKIGGVAPPYGFMWDDGRVVRNRYEYPIYRFIIDSHLAGKTGFQIAKALRASKTTIRGKRAHGNDVNAVINSYKRRLRDGRCIY